MESSHVAQTKNERRLPIFLTEYLPLFSINFLGLIAVRIWIQADLYDRYTSTDSGLITIATNLLRVAVIAIMLLVTLKKGFSPKAQRILSVASVAAMTAASALFLLDSAYPNQVALVFACGLAGFGIAWGGGMWICFYVRLQPGEALLYAFLSLAGSSFIGLLLGMIPSNIAFLVAMLMPTLSYIAFNRAQALLDKRSNINRESSFQPPVYDSEPRTTFFRLIAGVALFNFALGIARGFPSGASIELPFPFQIVHQGGAVTLSLLVIAWALIWKRSLRFSTLWNIAVTFIAAGVLALASMSESLSPFGAALVAIANTFSLGLLWYSCYDIARHSRWTSYAVLGVAWIAHILPREIGRAIIWVAEPHSAAAVAITTGIVCLVAISMALLLSDSIPRLRPLFCDFQSPRKGLVKRFDTPAPQRSDIAEPTENEEDETAPPETAIKHSLDEKQFADPLDIRLDALKHRYFLTDREIEVVALLARGRSKTAIGAKLYLSENTVKTYVKNAYAKLNVHSKQELLDRIDEQ